jgi:imidazolonepropionase-like amidohydrolase
VNAAALLGLTDVGEIAVGAEGDLVAVPGDPLQDLRVLARPALVVKGGRVIPLGSRPPPP